MHKRTGSLASIESTMQVAVSAVSALCNGAVPCVGHLLVLNFEMSAAAVAPCLLRQWFCPLSASLQCGARLGGASSVSSRFAPDKGGLVHDGSLSLWPLPAQGWPLITSPALSIASSHGMRPCFLLCLEEDS